MRNGKLVGPLPTHMTRVSPPRTCGKNMPWEIGLSFRAFVPIEYSFYDTETIDVKEIVEIVGNLFELEGVSKVGIVDPYVDRNKVSTKDTAMERATTVFKLLDVNADGELNEHEFVEGCLEDQNLINMLNSGRGSFKRLLGEMY